MTKAKEITMLLSRSPMTAAMVSEWLGYDAGVHIRRLHRDGRLRSLCVVDGDPVYVADGVRVTRSGRLARGAALAAVRDALQGGAWASTATVRERAQLKSTTTHGALRRLVALGEVETEKRGLEAFWRVYVEV